MRLAALASSVGMSVPAEADRAVSGFAIDHRKVRPGTVFGAFQGLSVNGEDFIPDAVKAGAVAVVARPQAVVEGAAHLADDCPRRAFARLAARYFAPAPAVIAAVTGTNGKTSVAEMTRQLWQIAGHKAASIGTLGIVSNDDVISTGMTTPDVVTFLANMNRLAGEGVTHAIYEASSHGLHQYRNEGLDVAAGAFTNLSREHLDYHSDMDGYFAAKMRLFDEVVSDGGAAVIWADDEWSARAIDHARKRGLNVLTVGKVGTAIRLVSSRPTHVGQRLALECDGEVITVDLPLIGTYQVANALVSAGLVIATGGDPAGTFAALEKLQPVRGRLERAAVTASGAPVFVDYAHTPDALRAAIDALRPHAEGRLIVVFGAGGDRDKGKRPEMGRIAAVYADAAFVTDDNPRSEDPAAIRAMVIEGANGVEGRCTLQDIGDRRKAIARAISEAGSKDIVLIAGKGHEQGQVFGAGADKRVEPFDDVTVARQMASAGGA